MTDAEEICGWMEPKPEDMERRGLGLISEAGWWKYKWSPMGQCYRVWPNDDKADSLDALHEVEEKLTSSQKSRFGLLLYNAMATPDGNVYTWHATTEQKIAALAQVIRGEREGRAA